MVAAALGVHLLSDTHHPHAKAGELAFYSLGLKCPSISFIKSRGKCHKTH